MKSETVELDVLAETLAITENEALKLFEKRRLSVREAIMDTILFSQTNNLRKMELILGKGSGR